MSNEAIEKVEVTDEDIQKALSFLGITQGDIQKGESKEEKEEPKDDDETDEDEIEKSYNKAKTELDELEKACSMKKGELEEMEKKRKKSPNDPLQKSEESDLGTNNVESLIKGLENSLSGKLNETVSSFKALYIKSEQEKEEIKKSFTEVTETVGKLSNLVTQMANQSIGRKSAPTARAIEKSMGSDELNGKQVLSLSRDKGKLENILLDLSGIERGETIDMGYASAATLLNTSGMLSKSIESDLFTKHNIKIVE